MIKEMQDEERPRERLIAYGANSLSNTELLAIILKTGTKSLNVLEISSNLLSNIKGFQNLKNISQETLTKQKGIGKVKAIDVLACIELGRRLFVYEQHKNNVKYITPKVVYEENKDLFVDKNQEYFYCIYLNSNKQVIERKMLFMGTVNKSIVHPREIFKEAYLSSASSIICLHNHPSGDPTPSVNDIILTKSLLQIADIQKIPIIDHIIFGHKKYYSFLENNNLK